MFYVYDKEKTRKIYFRLNPMPIWTLLDRNWFEKRTLPSIDEVRATASMASAVAVAADAAPQDRGDAGSF